MKGNNVFHMGTNATLSFPSIPQYILMEKLFRNVNIDGEASKTRCFPSHCGTSSLQVINQFLLSSSRMTAQFSHDQ